MLTNNYRTRAYIVICLSDFFSLSLIRLLDNSTTLHTQFVIFLEREPLSLYSALFSVLCYVESKPHGQDHRECIVITIKECKFLTSVRCFQQLNLLLNDINDKLFKYLQQKWQTGKTNRPWNAYIHIWHQFESWEIGSQMDSRDAQPFTPDIMNVRPLVISQGFIHCYLACTLITSVLHCIYFHTEMSHESYLMQLQGLCQKFYSCGLLKKCINEWKMRWGMKMI